MTYIFEHTQRKNEQTKARRSRGMRRTFFSYAAMTRRGVTNVCEVMALCIALFFVTTSAILAETKTDKDNEPPPIIKKEKVQVIKYRKKTRIDFTELTVQGDLKRPSGFLILKRKGIEFSGLINLRKDFDDKLYDSVNFIGK